MGWGSGNLGGGSDVLNFKIVGGTSEPSNPKENMIWVNTDQKITNWIFSSNKPADPVEGMVFISIRTSSAVEFNALKKNCIVLYPVSAYQYVSGHWEYVAAQIWHDGEWKNLLADTVFYENGAFNTEVFGEPTGNVNNTGSVLYWKNGNSASATKLFNVGGFDRIEIVVDSTHYVSIRVKLVDETGNVAKSKDVSTAKDAVTLSVDISGMSGSYYLQLSCSAGNNTNDYAYISRIKFRV